MTNQEIITKAIYKAIKNGYKGTIYPVYEDGTVLFRYEEQGTDLRSKDVSSFYWFLFSHDFAKAFFGTELHHKYEYAPEFLDEPQMISAWVFHLQQMVLEPEPLKYLEKFL